MDTALSGQVALVTGCASGIGRATADAGRMLADVDQYLEEMVKNGPLANLTQTVSEAEDVAAVIRFLCLPDSRQMTGQVLHTSAGLVV